MAPKWLPETKESEIQQIIQKLTTTGRKTLDEKQMKKLKAICKLSDKYVNCAYYSLMTQLQKGHAEIRYSTLLIINELFIRSSVFRSRLEEDLDEFLMLVVETDPEKPLPPPHPVAKELKIKGLEFIKNWASKFGKSYIRLPLAVKYLQNCKKVDFNDMEARTAAQRERQRLEQDRLDRIINEKISRVKSEMQEVAEEISSVAHQMENCFRLLIPHPSDNLFTDADFELSENTASQATKSDNTEGFDSGSSLRDHGLYDMKKTITIEVKKDSEIVVDVNEDTSPIIESLKDLEKQISNRFYPMITKWLKVLSKGQNCSDTLKKAIDLKLLMETNMEKYKELKIKPSKNKVDSDEDDDFEEVKEKEGYEDTVKVPKVVSKAPQSNASSTNAYIEGSHQWKMKHHREDMNDPTSALSTLSKRIKKSEPTFLKTESGAEKSNLKNKQIEEKKLDLLQKAPVLPYDIDLYHWEEEKPIIPETVRFDSLHKFWETKDDIEENETLKEVQIASLRTRKIDFSGKFEPVKWTCRTPLPSGKLCPRRDRYKCPFHGKIIPRDELGNPSSDVGCIPGPSKESSNQVPDWQDPQLLKDIEAATGIDLKVPDKKSKGGKKKKDGLTNIKKINNTVRDRLSKKIVKRYHHYARKLDEIERKRFNDKFGDQWNYY